jgi:hypothetical protein
MTPGIKIPAAPGGTDAAVGLAAALGVLVAAAPSSARPVAAMMVRNVVDMHVPLLDWEGNDGVLSGSAWSMNHVSVADASK